MKGRRNHSPLRRAAPLVVAVALAAPAAASAGGPAPDPSPGAAPLRPDAPPAVQHATRAATVVRVPARSVVERAPVVSQTPVARTPHRRAAPVARRRPSHRRPVRHEPLVFRLPEVVVPPLAEAAASSLRDPAVPLAAVALALAALTAGSGAALAYAWSRRLVQ